jgi:dipeptidase D
VSFVGGSKDNAIPRTCEVHAVALGMKLESINTIAAELQAEIRANYAEPEATIEAFNSDALGGNAISAEETAKLVRLLREVPNAIQAMSDKIPGLVQTSLNLGVAKLGEEFTLTWSVRSSVNQEKQDLLAKLRSIAESYGGSYTQVGEYPAWEYKEDSLLRDTMVKVYTEMYNKTPEVVAIHAGLECGLLGEKLPGLDAVSIGPEMHDIHTSREKLGIASTRRTWEFVLEVLKAL